MRKRFHNLSASFSGIASDLDNAWGSITNIRWVDSEDNVITKAVKGQPIKLMVDWTAFLPDWGGSWKVCCTAMETGISLSKAWKNYVQANSWAINEFEKTNMKLDQMSGGNFTMPDRNLNVVLKLWIREDTAEDYPPVGESWRN